MPSKRGRRRAVDALLVELCTGDAVEARVDARDADDLAAAARFHRIAPLAHVRLREARPDLAAGLRGDRDRARMHHLRVCATVAGLAGVLDGLEWLVFKGPVLSQVAHPVPGLRSYNDLDLLVAPDRLRETCSRLYEAGWRAVFDTDLLRGPELPGELALIGAAGLWLDLHWSVVLAQSSRRRSPVSTDELVERRVPVGLGGVTVATFDPADSLLHVCHHAALTGAKRLLHLLDADRLARRVEDWDEVVRRARAWHIQAELALVLGRARRLLVTPVPPDLNRRLGLSAGFGALMAGVDTLAPVPRLRAGGSVAGMVGRGVRPGAVATIAEAARLAASDPRSAGRSEPDKQWHPVDAATLEGYLAGVEAAASRAESG